MLELFNHDSKCLPGTRLSHSFWIPSSSFVSNESFVPVVRLLIHWTYEIHWLSVRWWWAVAPWLWAFSKLWRWHDKLHITQEQRAWYSLFKSGIRSTDSNGLKSFGLDKFSLHYDEIFRYLQLPDVTILLQPASLSNTSLYGIMVIQTLPLWSPQPWYWAPSS